jgi:hypothetical protein
LLSKYIAGPLAAIAASAEKMRLAEKQGSLSTAL